MTHYKSGDYSGDVLTWGESTWPEKSQSEIAYKSDTGWGDGVRKHSSDPARARKRDQSQKQPLTPSPSIRKELAQTNEILRLACEAMLLAHEGDDVDVVELANAVEDYRRCVDVLWRYREFGTEAWKSIIVFCQQALCENMHDEETAPQQCTGLKQIASGYLSNRLLAKEDVREVMLLLTSSGFDPMLFFSHPNDVE